MLVLNLPFKALMFLTLMRPSLVLLLVLWLKLVKDFLKVRCRLALLPFLISCLFLLFQAEDGIRDDLGTGVQTCALPICAVPALFTSPRWGGEVGWHRQMQSG